MCMVGLERESKNNITSHQANSGEKTPIYEVRALVHGAKFPIVITDNLCPTSLVVLCGICRLLGIYILTNYLCGTIVS
jgi:hypothetical protein